MKKRKKICAVQILFALLCGLVIFFGTITVALADVQVGDVIDKNNWQKAKGLVSDAVLEYLQKGYFTITVGKLNYDPGDLMPPEYKESLTKNAGRYGVTKDGARIDKKTGEIDPVDFIGLPFPVLDPNEPNFGEKASYNHEASVWSRGNMTITNGIYFIGKKLERKISGPFLTMSFGGLVSNIAQQSLTKGFGKGKLSTCYVMKITDPYELNGLATMSWAHFDSEPNKIFSYVPALRRARAMSAAAKSDSMFGSDYALDDAGGGFLGKARDFNWKYIRTQDALMQYLSPDYFPLVKRPDGSYEFKKPMKMVKFGFETPGWQGKPFVPTNSIWVKVKVHVIQGIPKDPYYNYGKFELWYEPKSTNYATKTIWDRAGKKWKVMVPCHAGYKSDDGLVARVDPAFGDWIYDEQRDHASSINEHAAGAITLFHAKHNVEMFTMNGMTKFAK